MWQETQLVNVEYPDGKGNHQTTIADLRKKWVGETSDWIDNFFKNLNNYGVAHSNFGSYKIATPYKVRYIKSTYEIKVGDVLIYTGIPRGSGFSVPEIGKEWPMNSEHDIAMASIEIIERRRGWWPKEL